MLTIASSVLAVALASLWGNWIWPILLLAIGLGLVIFMHELGHFLVAKFVGIEVERFAIGFGPKVVGFRKGQTEYCICALPLGGYVKMAGQEDFKPVEGGDENPGAFYNKTVGQRFAVISAGVVMNVILAALLFIIVCLIGIRFPAPVVGETVPNYPASKAQIDWKAPIDWQRPEDLDPNAPAPGEVGLMPGDEILSIQGEGFLLGLLGEKVTRFQQLYYMGALADPDEEFRLRILRRHGGKAWIGEARMGVKPLLGQSGGETLAFGIRPASSLTFAAPEDAKVLSPFEPGQQVVSLAGHRIEHSWQIPEIERKLTGKAVNVTLRTEDGGTVTKSLRPEIRSQYVDPNGVVYAVYHLQDGTRIIGEGPRPGEEDGTIRIRTLEGRTVTYKEDELISATELGLDILGMAPRLKVATVIEDSPAEQAGLQPGDVIVDYADQGPPTHREMLEINRRFAGKEATITLLRDGKLLEPRTIVPQERGQQVLIGISTFVDHEHLAIGNVRPGSFAAAQGVVEGDQVLRVDDQPVRNWHELYLALLDRRGQPVKLTLEAAGTLEIAELDDSLFDPALYRMEMFPVLPFEPLMGPKIRKGPIAAIPWGIRETGNFLTTTYATLKSLISGTVSGKELMGPVGITSVAIKVGRHEGIERFIYFMAMISVSLAVVNFLPIPVVDGGHAVFLLIEKVRGRPLPLKVMNAVQMAGLALLLLAFVAITWNDIARLMRGLW